MDSPPSYESIIQRLTERSERKWIWLTLALFSFFPVFCVLAMGFLVGNCRTYVYSGVAAAARPQNFKHWLLDSLVVGGVFVLLVWAFPSLLSVIGRMIDALSMLDLSLFELVLNNVGIGFGLWLFSGFFLLYLDHGDWRALRHVQQGFVMSLKLSKPLLLPIIVCLGLAFVSGPLVLGGVFAGAVPLCFFLSDLARRASRSM